MCPRFLPQAARLVPMPWLLLLVLSSPAPPRDSVLLERIHALIEGREVGLVLLPLDGRDAGMIEPDKAFHAASTMKVPVMIALFRQAEAGQPRLEGPLPIVNQFPSIGDGSGYRPIVGDDPYAKA